MESTISYGYPYASARIQTGTNCSENKLTPSSGYGQPSDVSVTNLLAGSHGPGASKAGYGKKSVYSLLNAPYHGVGMLSGALEVGVAVRDHRDVGSPVGPRVQSDFDLGYRYATGSQEPAADAVLTFPCEGSTDVDRDLTNEDPNPVPGRDLAVQPLGTSVIVRVRRGQMLKITRASMTETLTGKVVALRAPVSTAHGNDPHGSLDIWEAYVAADRPLLPRTQYSAQLEGTNDGRVLSRNFTFTTGD